ncbi:6-methylsalicylate decarboxylase [Marchantia polymorpha subsp. ruderalis]|uniref:Amidohydrolase-related domain-containing protein n=2 Tax=Marchantia polymorpha TaxID=3197 RepID=A0AAF6BV55_MARPO|nr:hypothetical protein MARPO_0099s0052 [Marchantia polymorpha]BBN15889.1 hypothetical protein Mp_7g01790 [Marchantia polymorpha subsp. ruderalis]|eukprot:PTQ32417.1 hypothetical protein MARPO_0099s0052 [Marchantia polymorpha]
MEFGSRRHRMLLVCSMLLLEVGELALSQQQRIDNHNHILPPFYLDWLAEQGYDAGRIPAWNASMHLEAMASIGTMMSIVSITTPGVSPMANTSVNASREMARKLNDYAYNELVLKYPGKFNFWATMTLPDIEGSIAEARYALQELNAAGVFLEGNKKGVYLGDPSLDPFFEVLNEMSAVVFVHPNNLPNTSPVPGLVAAVVDYTLDTTRAAVNLVFTNTTQKYPNITYIFSHAGGSLPFLAYRAAFTAPYYSETVMVDEFKKYYYDTALASTPSSLPTILEFATADRMTFGTDWPYVTFAGSKFYTDTIDAYPLSQADRELIYLNNSRSIFKHLSAPQ